MCRFCDQPTQIGQVVVPKGTFVYVLIHALHNSAQYWSDADQFIPDRWKDKTLAWSPDQSSSHKSGQTASSANAESGGSDQRQNSAKRFLPFSDGPRSCVAQVYFSHL